MNRTTEENNRLSEYLIKDSPDFFIKAHQPIIDAILRDESNEKILLMPELLKLSETYWWLKLELRPEIPLLPKELGKNFKHGCMPIKNAEEIYAMRNKIVSNLSKQQLISCADLEPLDRIGLFIVADELFSTCSTEAKEFLLNNQSPHVQSTAKISLKIYKINPLHMRTLYV